MRKGDFSYEETRCRITRSLARPVVGSSRLSMSLRRRRYGDGGDAGRHQPPGAGRRVDDQGDPMARGLCNMANFSGSRRKMTGSVRHQPRVRERADQRRYRSHLRLRSGRSVVDSVFELLHACRQGCTGEDRCRHGRRRLCDRVAAWHRQRREADGQEPGYVPGRHSGGAAVRLGHQAWRRLGPRWMSSSWVHRPRSCRHSSTARSIRSPISSPTRPRP